MLQLINFAQTEGESHLIGIAGPDQIVEKLCEEPLFGNTTSMGEENGSLQAVFLIQGWDLFVSDEEAELVNSSERSSATFLQDGKLTETPEEVAEVIQGLLHKSQYDPLPQDQHNRIKDSEPGLLVEQLKSDLLSLLYDEGDDEINLTWEKSAYNSHLQSLIASGQSGNSYERPEHGSVDSPAHRIHFASSILTARLTHFLVQMRETLQYESQLNRSGSSRTECIMPPATLPAEIDWIDKNPLSWAELFAVVWFVIKDLGPLVDIEVDPNDGDSEDNHFIRLRVFDKSRTKPKLADTLVDQIMEQIRHGLGSKENSVKVGIDDSSIMIDLVPD